MHTHTLTCDDIRCGMKAVLVLHLFMYMYHMTFFLCSFACVSCHLRGILYVCVCPACSHPLPSCSCMLSSCFGILPLRSVVGVTPAHLGKKTSKLAWFSHSTDSQDGMCASPRFVCVFVTYYRVYSVVIRHALILKFHSMIASV